MRKLTWAGVGSGVLATTAVCLVTTAGIAAAAAAHDGGTGKTIKYVSHQTHFKSFDLGKDGFGPGDYFVAFSQDKASSKQIGHDTVVCHFNFGGFADCTGTTVLAKGQIVTAGEAPSGDRFTLAIVGGTGAYKNAKGQALFHTINDTDVDVTLKLG